MPTHSAGLLPFHQDGDGLYVFLVHPGGPFFARKDAGAWSLAKGEFDPATENVRQAALREFAEEVGCDLPLPQDGLWVDLGTARLRSGKIVHALAVRVGRELAFVISNTFDLEWPRGSGRYRSFPEVDRGEWFSHAEALDRINPGQRPLLQRLPALLATGCP